MQSSAERTAFLDEACVGRRRCAAASTACSQRRPTPAAFSSIPRRRRRTPAIIRSAKAPARQIGPYKLLEQIGEGGMGVVFMAEQTRPVQRRVALKIIKLGMDTRQVVARFEAERQALAMMDHPNIARVLDAGATDIGPALFRDGVGPRRADHRVLRSSSILRSAIGWSCSSRSARPCNMPIRKGSSTATSSRPMCWSRCTTAGR